jgi:hypothetical protein
MEIEKIAAVSSGHNISGAVQSSGAQNSQIDELQRLADSIRKMENDVRITARVQGMSGAGLQTKLRQYDDLLGKVNQHIRNLQHQSSDNGKSAGVSMLKYKTDATRLKLSDTGTSTAAAAAEQQQSVQASAVERRVEQAAKAHDERPAPSGLLNMLI